MAYELEILNRFYNEDKFYFIVIYIKRCIEKTNLLTEFCNVISVENMEV